MAALHTHLAAMGGVVNLYWPGGRAVSGTTEMNCTGLSVGASSNLHPFASRVFMMHQTQGATIDSSDSASYGDGNAALTPGGGAQSGDDTGMFEFVYVTGTDTNTQTLTLSAPLMNTYSSASPNKFQIVDVITSDNAGLSSTLLCFPWNGEAGGILALTVDNVLTMNGNSLSCAGRGFREEAGSTMAHS